MEMRMPDKMNPPGQPGAELRPMARLLPELVVPEDLLGDGVAVDIVVDLAGGLLCDLLAAL
eukprot:9946375-Alexandrium_andersonii.AAC.1